MDAAELVAATSTTGDPGSESGDRRRHPCRMEDSPSHQTVFFGRREVARVVHTERHSVGGEGQVSDSSIQFFSVIDGSRLQSDGALIDPLLSWKRIRIVGLHGKEWHIDPLVEVA